MSKIKFRCTKNSIFIIILIRFLGVRMESSDSQRKLERYISNKLVKKELFEYFYSSAEINKGRRNAGSKSGVDSRKMKITLAFVIL